MKQPCVYMLASRKHGTIYIGSSGYLAKRLFQHVEGKGSTFTAKHGVKRLVDVEFHESMTAALEREKQLKKWNRAWKIRLIEAVNPQWDDISADVLQ